MIEAKPVLNKSRLRLCAEGGGLMARGMASKTPPADWHRQMQLPSLYSLSAALARTGCV